MLPVNFNNTVTALENNPHASGAMSVGSMLIALFIKVVEHGRLNPLVMDVTQYICWVIGGLVGLCSLVGFTKQFITWLSEKRKRGRQTPSQT